MVCADTGDEAIGQAAQTDLQNIKCKPHIHNGNEFSKKYETDVCVKKKKTRTLRSHRQFNLKYLLVIKERALKHIENIFWKDVWLNEDRA